MSKIIWNAGDPPKRGPYRVKCEGPNANAGYRYWFGDHWGVLCQKRSSANAKNESRRVTLQRPVLWGSPAPAPTIWSDEFNALLLAYRIAAPGFAMIARNSLVCHIDKRLK